jgi:hypothetical protein
MHQIKLNAREAGLFRSHGLIGDSAQVMKAWEKAARCHGP